MAGNKKTPNEWFTGAVGVSCLVVAALGLFLNLSDAISIAFIVAGVFLWIVAVLGSRLEGNQKFGPTGAEFNLDKASKDIKKAENDLKAGRSFDCGEIPHTGLRSSASDTVEEHQRRLILGEDANKYLRTLADTRVRKRLVRDLDHLATTGATDGTPIRVSTPSEYEYRLIKSGSLVVIYREMSSRELQEHGYAHKDSDERGVLVVTIAPKGDLSERGFKLA